MQVLVPVQVPFQILVQVSVPFPVQVVKTALCAEETSDTSHVLWALVLSASGYVPPDQIQVLVQACTETDTYRNISRSVSCDRQGLYAVSA